MFKLVPELFVHEINKLGAKDRARFKKPRISFARADGESLEVDEAANAALLEAENDSDALFDKSMQMEMYYLEQTSDLFNMYSEKLDEEVLYGKHVDL